MNYTLLVTAVWMASKPWRICIFCLYAAILSFSLQGYLNWKSPVFLFEVFALFSVITVDGARKGSRRFAYVSLALTTINLLMPVKTILYGSIACAVLFTVEDLYGRMSLLPVIMLALISPFFQYLCDVFTFPVRLQLTAWAGKALQLAGIGAATQGNIIVLNGNEFSVDPACMGLNMMVTSLVAGIVLTAVYQKQYRKQVPLWITLLLLVGIAGMNVAANLFRIVLTVRFCILPETWMHDFTGLVCFLVYVILPGSLLCKWTIRHWRRNLPDKITNTAQLHLKSRPALHLLVVSSLLFTSFLITRHNKGTGYGSGKTPAVEGYSAQQIDAGIVKLENTVSLVYIKKIPAFYAADHTPLICWKGSGYVFKQINQLELHGTKVYSGTLQKGNEQLSTIWWYDNGRRTTVNQLEWRWDMLKGGENYSIVNVTSLNEKLARKEAGKSWKRTCLKISCNRLCTSLLFSYVFTYHYNYQLYACCMV